MALITCPECGKQVSSMAPMCPTCGYPISTMNETTSENTNKIQQKKYDYKQCKPDEYKIKKKRFVYTGSSTAIIIPDEFTSFERASDTILAIFIGRNIKKIEGFGVEWFDVSEDNPFFASVDGVLFNKDKTEIVQYPLCRDLGEYEVPLWVKSIRKDAFSHAGLESVVLHDNLNIEEGAFSFMKKLKTIKWAGKKYPDNTWPPSVKLPYKVFNQCAIDSIVLMDGIEEINQPFYGCPIESIKIPNTVKTLALGIMSKLKEIKIPESVEILEKEAFYGCDSLPEITIPNSVKVLGEKAFSSCRKIKEIKIPESVKSIGIGCFSYCTSLETVHLPQAIDTIPADCFRNSSLESLTIPESVKTIGKCAFVGCKLKKIELPLGLEIIEDSAFYGSGIKTIVVSDTVKEYGSLFKDVENVVVSEAALHDMTQEEQEKKKQAEQDRARSAKLLADADKLISEIEQKRKDGEFFEYQREVKRLVRKREENKAQLSALLSSRNYSAYNNLVLETNEIEKEPAYTYNECGRTVKLYNRNGIDGTFAIEVNGVVYPINPSQVKIKDAVSQSETDASQLDKAIMTGIAGGSLLGYIATSFARVYNTIDVSFSFENKRTGRVVKVVLGDNDKVDSKVFPRVMKSINTFLNTMKQITGNIPLNEQLGMGHLDEAMDIIIASRN